MTPAPRRRVPARARTLETRRRTVTRVQTGIRIEKKLLLVLRALAGTLDLSMGDLLEGILLHAFDGKAPFSRESLKKIKALKEVYGLELTSADSHRLIEVLRKRPRVRPT